MKLSDLHTRVVETTGLDVLTASSLYVAMQNCVADLTSRGYRDFVELFKPDMTIEYEDNATLIAKIPGNIRKVLYCRAYFQTTGVIASRFSLANPKLESKFVDGRFRTPVPPQHAIFYLKQDKLVIEWDRTLGAITSFAFGYLTALEVPPLDTNINEADIQDLDGIEINIRKEYEDALVFYAAYFYYSRYGKDTEKL